MKLGQKWRQDPHDVCAVLDGNTLVAICKSGNAYEDVPLIAAAPELFEALVFMRALVSVFLETTPEVERLLLRADAAIAKARGVR